MIAADPDPAQRFPVRLFVPGGQVAEYVVPFSWKAWQSALAVFDLRVTLAPEDSELPRWVAEMRLPGGVAASVSASYLLPTS